MQSHRLVCRAPRRLAASEWHLTLALLLAVLGCREDPTAPIDSPSAPEHTAAATQTLSFVQVSAGGVHTCGVTADNRAYCWGDNRYGELGDGTTTPRLVPVA